MTADDALPAIGGYELLGELGRGASGVVYRARHVALDRIVALKVVDASELADPADAGRFLRGAKAAARLDHPNIVRIFDVGRTDDLHYYAMALVDGPSLAQRLAQNGPLPPREAAELVQRVAQALEYTHGQQVVHRGLSPDCILLEADGRPRVIGFGTAGWIAHQVTVASQGNQVSPYTPPERLDVADAANEPRIDVYGLGGILYAALTGKPPFTSDSAISLVTAIADEAPVAPTKVKRQIPRELERICLRCLAKNPTDRFASAAAVAEALRQWLKPESTVPAANRLAETRPTGQNSTQSPTVLATRKFSKRVSRQRLFLATGGVFVIGFVLVIAVRPWISGEPRSVPPAPLAMPTGVPGVPGDSRTTTNTDAIPATLSSDDKLLMEFRSIDQRLAESLPVDGWVLDYATAAESLERLFGEQGLKVLKQSPTELRTALESRPAEIQDEVKHWLIRWELYATLAQRPELDRLRAVNGAIDDDAWSHQFLAARSSPSPATLLALAKNADPNMPLDRCLLLVEALTARSLLDKPEAMNLLLRASQRTEDSPHTFWIHLRDAQANWQQFLTSKKTELADAAVVALSLATATRPQVASLEAHLDQIRPLSPMARERDLAAWVMSRGGYVQIWQPKIHEWAHFPVYRTDDLPSGVFHISGVSLSNCELGDQDLPKIHALPTLQRIYLDGTKVTDAGVRDWLKPFKSLKVLSLERTSVSDDLLPACSSLEQLFARKTQITPAGVAAFTAKLPNASVLLDDAPGGNTADVNATGYALEFGPHCQVKGKVRLGFEQPFTLEARLRYKATLAFNDPWTVGLLNWHSAPRPLDMNAIAIGFEEDEQAVFHSAGHVRGWAGARSSPLRATVAPDKMLHLAGVTDRTHFRTYVDGRLVAEVPISPYEFDPELVLYVGSHGMVVHPEVAKLDCSFQGGMDEVRISSVARYAADFTPARRHEPDEHTVLLYHFDEGQGDITHDASGNRNHGKIIGAKWVKEAEVD